MHRQLSLMNFIMTLHAFIICNLCQNTYTRYICVQLHICFVIPITAHNGKKIGDRVHQSIPYKQGNPVDAWHDVSLWPVSVPGGGLVASQEAQCLPSSVHSHCPWHY